jgi:hypothetical protein
MAGKERLLGPHLIIIGPVVTGISTMPEADSLLIRAFPWKRQDAELSVVQKLEVFTSRSIAKRKVTPELTPSPNIVPYTEPPNIVLYTEPPPPI